MAVWRCEDCKKVGFYFDISPEEMREKHKLECTNMRSPIPAEDVGLPEGGWYLNWSDKCIRRN